MRFFVFGFFAAVATFGCGSSGDDNNAADAKSALSVSQLDSSCQAMCDNTGFEQACNSAKKQACQQDCTSKMQLLPGLCVRCLLDNSRKLRRGSCSGTGPNGEPGSCSCYSAEFAPISQPQCKDFCKPS